MVGYRHAQGVCRLTLGSCCGSSSQCYRCGLLQRLVYRKRLRVVIFSLLFENPECEVVAIAAERTFWEKATILHQEAHRQKQIPQRHSRHYYDLYKLAGSAVRASALAQTGLLRDVVTFKQRFYPSAWTRYDLAVPGAFKLLPT